MEGPIEKKEQPQKDNDGGAGKYPERQLEGVGKQHVLRQFVSADSKAIGSRDHFSSHASSLVDCQWRFKNQPCLANLARRPREGD